MTIMSMPMTMIRPREDEEWEKGGLESLCARRIRHPFPPPSGMCRISVMIMVVHRIGAFIFFLSLSITAAHSAASAGALEFMTIYSTSNLPKLLNSARDDGWTVLGAAADVPDGAAIRGGGSDNEDYDDDDDDDEGNKWDLGDSVAVDDIDDDENPGSIRPKPRCFDLNDVKTGRPTIIVLGSEGELHDRRTDVDVGISNL